MRIGKSDFLLIQNIATKMMEISAMSDDLNEFIERKKGNGKKPRQNLRLATPEELKKAHVCGKKIIV